LRLAEIIRLAVAILLLPFCAAAAVVLGKYLVDFGIGLDVLSDGGFAIFLGGVAYVGVFVFFDETVLALPFARGNVQRFWGTFIGYRGPRSPGAAESASDSDSGPAFRPLLVVPYMVPIYTVVAIPAIYLISWAFDIYDRHWLRSLQGFLLGATFTFHVFLVGNDIRRKHRDLRAVGYLLTLVIIFIICVQVVAAAMMAVFPGASWVEFNQKVLSEIRYAYDWSWDLVASPFR
jgi:hypothetical protein